MRAEVGRARDAGRRRHRAVAIPIADRAGGSPLERAEHALQPWVAFLVLPAFAFVNAGVSLAGIDARPCCASVPLGHRRRPAWSARPVGVVSRGALDAARPAPRLPEGAGWRQFIGVAFLCGIGFTMSLFIGGLAFEGLDARYETQVKLGVIGGSLVAAAIGVALLLVGAPLRRPRPAGAADARRSTPY